MDSLGKENLVFENLIKYLLNASAPLKKEPEEMSFGWHKKD